jgi:integrase
MRVGRSPERTLADAIRHYLTTPEYTALRSKGKLAGHIKRLVPYIHGLTLKEAPEAAARLKKALTGTLAPATVNQSLKALRRICRLAWTDWEWLADPVHQRIGLLKVENERHEYASYEEARAILDEMDRTRRRHQGTEQEGVVAEAPTVIELAFVTGMRLGEIVALDARRVRDGAILIPARTKNGKPRKVRLPRHLHDLGERLPFSITVSAVSKAFKRAARRVGLAHLRAHDARHTTASWIINSGGTLEDVRAILGHLSSASSARYAHLAQAVADRRLGKIQGEFARRLPRPEKAEAGDDS